jgi:hypothetical protein
MYPERFCLSGHCSDPKTAAGGRRPGFGALAQSVPLLPYRKSALGSDLAGLHPIRWSFISG